MKNFLWLITGLFIGVCGTILSMRFRNTDSPSVSAESNWQAGKDPPLVTSLAKEVTNPFSPIKFNAKVNEYQLVYGYNTNEIAGNITNAVRYTFYCPLLYDPWTGKKLPNSTRPDAILKSHP
jgi:hypothetical protein